MSIPTSTWSLSPSGARAALVALAALVAGCQSVEPGSNPFTPVAVESKAAAAPVATKAGADGRFPPKDGSDDVTLSSEQMRSGGQPQRAAGQGAGGEPANPDAPVASGDDGQDAVADADPADAGQAATEPAAAPEPAPLAEQPTTAAALAAVAAAPGSFGMQGAFGAAAWPVRLVRTLPETQPPRAILGLSDGREIVVTPGAFIADHQLVVMAIGKQTLQLARVVPSGDHAVVSQTTLTALY